MELGAVGDISQPIPKQRHQVKDDMRVNNEKGGKGKSKTGKKSQKRRKKKSKKDKINLFDPCDPRGLFCKSMDTIAFTVKEFIMPSVESTEVWMEDLPFKRKLFKTVISMKWPEEFDLEFFDRRKEKSYKQACLHACLELQKLGVLDPFLEPLIPNTRDYPFDVTEAKNYLEKICQGIQLSTQDIKITAEYEIIPPASVLNCCTCILTITYPEEMKFTSVAFLPKNAEFMAASEALMWLKIRGFTVPHKKGVFVDCTQKNLKKLKKSHLTPIFIHLPSTVQDNMQNLLNDTEDFFSSEDLIKNPSCENNPKSVETDDSFWEIDEKLVAKNQVWHETNETDKNCTLPVNGIPEVNSLLPICQKRDEILKVISEHQVVVLSGDTGCGKSTQVPQLILNDYIGRKKGKKCNIIVAEPRCISATSLAERIANERGEKVGETVGYHIRLYKCLPQGSNGSILFYTTGMLIRKLHSNPKLQGISHVIIDEAHERLMETDFILILLKDILQINNKIKVIIMSASMNTHSFAQYFNSCPVINIAGKIYPVEEYFLEDLTEVVPNINMKQKEASLDVNLIINVIIYIDKTQPEGAILCFLPGWHDLLLVQSNLLKHKGNRPLFVCLVHSKLPHEEKMNIFLPPPEGHRKVILATNIAETSVTVNDVVYVVNSGLHKCTKFDEKMAIASLNTQWIAEANVQQRKGRAGRIQAGKCYNLFTKKVFTKMKKYPVAEILRMPLECVILNCKLFYPDTKAGDILLKSMQPPSATSVKYAIKELQELEILDDNEKLTTLGNIVGKFSVHPRLAVALVYATFLGCLDPVLTICVILSLEKEPFHNTLEERSLIKKIKQMHDYGLRSDHLSLITMYNIWITSSSEADATEYLEENLLDGYSFLYIQRLKELLARNLCAAGFIPSAATYCDENYLFNTNSCHPASILASLTAAFYPNVLKCVQGEIISGKIRTNTFACSTVKGNSAHIQKESVVVDEKVLPSPWLIFFTALKSEARNKAMITSVSSVPNICLLLFSRGSLTLEKVTNLVIKQEDLSLVLNDEYEMLRFLTTTKEAHLLLNFRERLKHIFKLYLQNLKEGWENERILSFYTNKFVPTLNKILDVPQVPFSIKMSL